MSSACWRRGFAVFRPRHSPKRSRSATLPFEHEGRSIAAARAAVELALLDLAGKAFACRSADAALESGLSGFGPPGCLDEARYSGIVIGRSPTNFAGSCAGRAYGLRDFKIKVAVAGWEERLDAAYNELQGVSRAARHASRRCERRLVFEQAAMALPLLERCCVSALEQPLAKADDAKLAALAKTRIDLIADESLGTLADALRLIASGVKVLNVRIAKNGGLLPSLRIAKRLAGRRLRRAARLPGRRNEHPDRGGSHFWKPVLRLRFVEGAFGGWLLKGDVTRSSIRFGLGGRIRRPPRGHGLGITVSDDRLRARFAQPAAHRALNRRPFARPFS